MLRAVTGTYNLLHETLRLRMQGFVPVLLEVLPLLIRRQVYM